MQRKLNLLTQETVEADGINKFRTGLFSSSMSVKRYQKEFAGM